MINNNNTHNTRTTTTGDVEQRRWGAGVLGWAGWDAVRCRREKAEREEVLPEKRSPAEHRPRDPVRCADMSQPCSSKQKHRAARPTGRRAGRGDETGAGRVTEGRQAAPGRRPRFARAAHAGDGPISAGSDGRSARPLARRRTMASAMCTRT